MTYTNTWNESVPTGGAPANTIDDVVRALELNIRERLNSIMGYAITTPLTDPVIPVGAGLMESQDISMFIPVWAMSWVPAASTLLPPANNTATGLDVVANTHTTGYFWCPIIIPVGAVISPAACELSFNQSGGTIVYDIKGYARLKTASTNTTVFTGNGSGALTGVQNLGFGPAVAYTTLTDTYYSLGFYVTPSAGTTCTVYGVRIRYTVPDIRVRF